MNQWLAARQTLEKELADPKCYQPDAKDRLQALLDERARIAEAIALAENRWLEATETLEAAAEDS
jgi:hypothetical protein